jgi:hypothetical protein
MARRMYRLAMAIMALFILAIPSGALALQGIQPDGVAVTAGTELERAVKEADGKCVPVIQALQGALARSEAQKADLQKAADLCKADLSQCQSKKDCEPKPKKTNLVVNVCVTPAVKVGNKCDCSGEPVLQGENAVPVRTDGKSFWVRYWTCGYRSSALAKEFELRKTQINNLCEGLDQLPTLEESETSVSPDVATDRMRCLQTKAVVESIYQYLLKLKDAGLTPKEWKDFQGRADGSLMILCEPQGDENIVQACAREKQDWENWREKKDAKDKEQDRKIEEVNRRVDAIGLTRLNIGGDLSYVHRMGRVPGSTIAAGLLGFYHQSDSDFGYSFAFLPGVALNEWSDRLSLGGEFLLHFGINDSLQFILGARGNAEIVGKGDDAGNGAALAGLGLTFESVRAKLFAEGGGSYVRLYHDGLRGHDTIGPLFGLGLSLMWQSRGWKPAVTASSTTEPTAHAEASTN